MNKSLAITVSLFFMMSIVVVNIPFINAQSVGNIIINSDGSVTGTNNIQQVGNTYTLTSNITGNIEVQKSNIVINGAGYSINQGGIDLTNNVQHDPTQPVIGNVTIENLIIENGGITNSGGNNTFYDDYITNSLGGACISLMGVSDYNKITFCTLNGSKGTQGAIMMVLGSSYNTITEDNLIGGINQYLSYPETVDRNYWSDYLTNYPNATEVDDSGVGNTPYLYSPMQNERKHYLTKIIIP